jgi:hypothetical protein
VSTNHIFEIRTGADTRSKSKVTRTWTIEAADVVAAKNQAIDNHLTVLDGMRWYDRSVFCTVLTVDGATYLYPCCDCGAEYPTWQDAVRCEAAHYHAKKS